MTLTLLFEAENDAGEYIPISLKMAKKLIEKGTHYTEPQTFGFLQSNEVIVFTLLKVNQDGEE
jgi:hypothetical protein